MTAAPSWDTGGPTDAELARAAASGDREAFAGIYDRYADRLHDFCVGMLRDRDGAADCVQDAFCSAATRLTQLREPDKLRPWLYAIARNEALRRLRERRRETPSDELPDVVTHEPGPDTLAARTELADLIAEAAGGLSDRDRSVLELAYRHGLDAPDLADALGVSPTNATKMVYRLRETIERSLGALLVSRRARATPDGCPELGAILDGWDGHFSVLMRKRIARHIESCSSCDEERRRLVSPRALLGAAPVFIPAPAWLRERTLNEIQLTSSATTIAGDTVDTGGAASGSGSTDSGHDERRTPSVLLPVAIFVGILIISLGLTIAWLYRPNAAIVPTDVTDTAPKTAGTAPAPPTAGVPTTVPAITMPPAPFTPPVQPPAPPKPPPAAPPELPPAAPPADPEPPVVVDPPPPPPPDVPPRLVPEPPPEAPERPPVNPRLDPQPGTPILPGPITPRQPAQPNDPLR